MSFAPSSAAASERFAIIVAAEFAMCLQPIYEQYFADVLDRTGARLDGVTIETERYIALTAGRLPAT